MSEPARCVWCKVAVEGQFALGSACPHCGKVPLLLEAVPEVRQEHSYGNEPEKDPDLFGPGGRAWHVTLAPETAERAHGGVCTWLVHAPRAHPMWWWYSVGVIHLRATEGLPPAHVQFPGATHEVLIMALNPDHPLPDVDAWQAVHYLLPPDLAEQFIVSSDEMANALGFLLVRHIVLDAVSPDQDHREYWRQAIANTAEDLRIGCHPDQDDDGGLDV